LIFIKQPFIWQSDVACLSTQLMQTIASQWGLPC